MILEFHDRMRSPQKANASRLVIRLRDGTPVAIVYEISAHQVRHVRAGDPEFEQELQNAGVLQTVVVHKVGS